MISDVLNIINKFIPDKDEAERVKADLEKSYNNALTQAVQADTKVRLAELGAGGLASKWRPISALIVFLAIFVRFPLYHFMKLMVGWYDLKIYLPELENLPQEFYGMATAFISIYAYGRSMEKRFKK